MKEATRPWGWQPDEGHGGEPLASRTARTKSLTPAVGAVNLKGAQILCMTLVVACAQLVVGAVSLPPLSSNTGSAFEVVWNGPSAGKITRVQPVLRVTLPSHTLPYIAVLPGCQRCSGTQALLTSDIEKAGIMVNEGQSFNGSVITLFYATGCGSLLLDCHRGLFVVRHS